MAGLKALLEAGRQTFGGRWSSDLLGRTLELCMGDEERWISTLWRTLNGRFNDINICSDSPNFHSLTYMAFLS